MCTFIFSGLVVLLSELAINDLYDKRVEAFR